MKTVVCPGSFDPVTNGHLDIIRRASGLFDRVIVLVAYNLEKQGVFPPEERCRMLQKVVSNDPALSNVTVEMWSGLLVDFLQKSQASAIVKGLRAVSDFEYEFQMALTNNKLLPGCETLFFTPSADNMYLSSKIVRQVCSLGGDITDFVPGCVLGDIRHKLYSERSCHDGNH
ncbi:MAG: pantetheine-phosphate adenylyltransferase [Angelakisella sp.]